MSEQAEQGSDTEQLRKSLQKEGVSYLGLVRTKCAGKMFAAGVNSLLTSLNGVKWSDFTETQKFVAIATMSVAMWQVMDAFLNTSLRALSDADKLAIAKETTT